MAKISKLYNNGFNVCILYVRITYLKAAFYLSFNLGNAKFNFKLCRNDDRRNVLNRSDIHFKRVFVPIMIYYFPTCAG